MADIENDAKAVAVTARVVESFATCTSHLDPCQYDGNHGSCDDEKPQGRRSE